MLLTSLDPFAQEFDRLVQRVFDWSGNGGQSTRNVMPMDAIRRKDDVLLRFDLPGIDPQTIDVTVDRGVLAVSARRAEKYGEGESAFVRERVMGTFTRRVYLADTLDAGKIEAAYTDGVLAVRVPVLEVAKPRKIEIRGAGEKVLEG